MAGQVFQSSARGRGELRLSIRTLRAPERRTLVKMALAVAALHAAGFITLFAVLASEHHGIGGAGTLTAGIGLAAYMLGLRHAFDADHLAAIDNTTRKLISDGRRPLSVGFWFSLGHSTVVFALAVAVALGVSALAGPVGDGSSSLHRVAGPLGTLVSGGFLYLIAALNLLVLRSIFALSRTVRAGGGDAHALEAELQRRGLVNRLLGSCARRITRPPQIYPVGVLFGLGFDTATEVALLVLAAGAAGGALPWYAVLCLPVLFAAGMVLLDTLDGALMVLAYGWARRQPARKLYYNLIVTGLSVAVALLVGTIELGGLLAERAGLSGGFWSWFEGIDLNLLGLAIVGLFLLTWLLAAGVWRLARVEQRWGAGAEGAGMGL